MVDPEQYDVIIVGAGPAGNSTALHLAQLAPDLVERTLILEKAHHPRPKLCGGGILADGEVILRQLGLDIREIPHCDVDWLHFDYEGKGMRIRSRKNDEIAFRTIRRHEFDAWLAGKARQRGFLIREDTAVKRVAADDGRVLVETNEGTYRAAVVVGADGSKSVVRRAVIPREATHSGRLLEIVTEPRPQSSFHRQADAYCDFLYLPDGILGYSWDFPALENGQAIRVRGIYDSDFRGVRRKAALRGALGDEFRRHGYDLNDYKLEGHPLRWFKAGSVFATPHILLAGDAAGVDGLAGEGISFALGYGALAAGAIQDAFARQDFSFRGYRAAILHSEMGKALKWRERFAFLLFRLRAPLLQAILWRKLGWLITPIVRRFLFEWAFREEERIRSGKITGP